ncbi:AAA family ATPase [Scytonema sp. UIC 10036]|uniref:trifunctional serine/threonine-protein kinase/ATP-binding protein/sensor histidine kinase n=1 Tax=Scytonema sp. UIC 10036 TaxID=2304196 RepID=UPI0012DAF100|nr:ATP-binding sensor histidine kinase [Scytonema sp. UIC 10036]MUG97476.1 AAA family ATPase [Scytonema sp. UIC 10036]
MTTATLSGYQLLDILYSGGKTIIYRGRREIDNISVIVKTLSYEHPPLEEIARLRHEYQILQPLHIPSVVKPYELKNYQHSLALVLEDVRGCLLKEAIATQTTSLMAFLKVAINLAHTLGELHAQGIIHKDIKPQNLLIDPNSCEVKFIDFSISSRLDRENPTLNHLSLLEGTLAYMSPEQTGRMNRAIDYRTDFYSLGVTLYEMLTGTLPFHATDPMELVHCHIAKKPASPCQDTVCRVTEQVPETISAIILKLLAKTAEERYQSAWGLKADLEECLFQLQTTGTIENFVPGRRDKSGQFSIGQRLYGREAEVTRLMEAFERVAFGSSELMLVSGYSGIGKTSVVNEVHKPIVGTRGYFIAGKFDQFKRNIPYASLIEAFQSLIQQLLTQSVAQIQGWKDKLLTALGENGQVIIDVIPEVELIIGTQPPVAQLGAAESQNRFNRVFGQFVGVFTAKEHPLVLFLDDLQWADSASLNLIELLMTDSDRNYLLLIGAYRDNEVSPTHPLMLSLSKIETAGAVVNNIILLPLQLKDVEALIGDTLNTTECSKALAELLFYKTGGNPFFLTQLLKTLHQEDLLTYNFQLGMWQWDIQDIQAIGITDLNVVELMARNIRKLSHETQNVLKLAACVGNTFNLDVLAIVNEASCLTTAAQLWSALQAGLILPLSQDYKIPLVFGQEESGEIALTDVKVDYKFLHDRVQQAAYSLIPDEQKKATHLKIGQLLLQNTTAEERRENVFALVNQLNYGADLLISESEKYELAELNLIAGQKAKAATAYESAVKYLNVGLELITNSSWHQYDLTLALYVETVATEYLNTNFERAKQLSAVVIQNARTLLEKVPVYETQIQYYIAQNQMQAAIDTALETLNLLGEPLPEMPEDFSVLVQLIDPKNILAGKSIEDLADLPQMSDRYKIATLRILVTMIPSIFVAAPHLFPLVILKTIHLSVEYGNSPPSIYAYPLYAMNLIGMLSDFKSGYRFGQLSLKLLDKMNAKEFKPKVYGVYNFFVRQWNEPARNTIEPFKEGIQSALETGDLELACRCATFYCNSIFFMGEPLEKVYREQTKYFNLIQKYHQKFDIDYTSLWIQGVLNLTKKFENTEILSGDFFNEETDVSVLTNSQNHMALFSYYVLKSTLYYLFKNYASSLEYAKLAFNYTNTLVGMIHIAQTNFYYSLSLLALYNQAEPKQQEEYLAQVLANQNEMEKWAYHAPSNFKHKYELVEAEKARVLGQYEKAVDYYERSMQGANKQGYLQEEALANELAADFHLSLGREKIAKTYITDAYYGYIHWGAVAKAKDLEEKYPQLIVGRRETAYREILLSIGKPETNYLELTQTNSTLAGGSQILDLMTVMKASQVLSEEMVLSHLLAKMMKIVIENAGAIQGYFLTKHGHQWIPEATGIVESQGISVTVDSEGETNSPLLPVALFNYVERTRSHLVLDDAVKDLRFATDTYIMTHQSKSILCLPLLYSSKLIGVLYLENHLIGSAFTSERVKVLTLLSAQISIAIDNARLYTNLQTYSQQLEAKSEELEAKNEALQASETREREKATQLEQYLHQLQLTQAQLVQTEKMSSLGQLVAGVAHEINNPVNFIFGNLTHAKEYTQDVLGLLALYQKHYPFPHLEIQEQAQVIDLEFLLQDLPKLLSSMRIGAERIQKIVASLRTFSRMDEAEMKSVNLHDGIESTLMILQHRLKAKSDSLGIEVIKHYGNLPLVECYAGQLNQVFMNILSNAIDSLESIGTTNALKQSLPSEREILTNPTITIVTEQVDNYQVEIRIADNGPGIPESVRQRLFDLFFTTKPVGKGTGMGLSISYQIVTEKHGGSLLCRSELGQGAEFIIRVPIRQQ